MTLSTRNTTEETASDSDLFSGDEELYSSMDIPETQLSNTADKMPVNDTQVTTINLTSQPDDMPAEQTQTTTEQTSTEHHEALTQDHAYAANMEITTEEEEA